MPELPEVESIRSLLSKEVAGKRVVSLKKSRLALRKPLAKSLLYFKGARIESFSRWGKRLYIEFKKEGRNGFLEVSLGMSGAFRFYREDAEQMSHDHFKFYLEGGGELIYNDPRRFGWVSYVDEIPEARSWDPLLGNSKQFKLAVHALNKTERSLYAFLMDQTYITGLGNIYVQESLFRAGLNPNLKGRDITREQADKLFKICKAVLRESVKLGGCTLKDHKLLDGSKGRFQEKLMVYGMKKQEPCLKCGAKLIHQKKPRTLTWCKSCQK